MRFQVPQFIGVEDRIFGPFTVKQFLYLAGGAGACFIIYSFLPFFLAVLAMAPVAGFALALAFYQVNGKPFVFIVEAAVKYFFGDKLFIWRKVERKPESKTSGAAPPSAASIIPKMSDSKLKELTWSLDINKNIRR